MNFASSDILWFIFSRVVTRRFKLGVGSSGQDRPWLTEEAIMMLISAKVVTIL